MSTKIITDRITQNFEKIIARLADEEICVYEFLKSEFDKCDVTKNFLFQFVFRSFYRLDNAGLTKEWKERYFELMQKYRITNLDLGKLVLELSAVPTLRGHNSLQFSFATKLYATVYDEKPIYDSYIANVFGFKPPTTGTMELRINRFVAFYNELEETYKDLLVEGKLEIVLQEFDKKFIENTLSQTKK